LRSGHAYLHRTSHSPAGLAFVFVPFFFQEMNHARRPEFAVQLRVLALEAGPAHGDLVFFALEPGVVIGWLIAACHLGTPNS